jgi:hypothetical protein
MIAVVMTKVMSAVKNRMLNKAILSEGSFLNVLTAKNKITQKKPVVAILLKS